MHISVHTKTNNWLTTRYFMWSLDIYRCLYMMCSVLNFPLYTFWNMKASRQSNELKPQKWSARPNRNTIPLWPQSEPMLSPGLWAHLGISQQFTMIVGQFFVVRFSLIALAKLQASRLPLAYLESGQLLSDWQVTAAPSQRTISHTDETQKGSIDCIDCTLCAALQVCTQSWLL